MRSPLVIVPTVLMIALAATACGRRERVTVVTPPAAQVVTGPAVVASLQQVIIRDTPRFREYVVTQRVPSYTYRGEVIVGTELPAAGVTYYEVPQEFATTQYRYAMVNNRLVLVDPVTHRIVQIIG